MNENHFLEEIITNPADDEPRLIYADWLCECGDPRGEFIQLQIRRESLEPGSLEAQASRRRERQLVEENAEEWSNGVHAITPSYEYRRGFISKIGLDLNKFLEHADSLFSLAPIDTLSTSECNTSRITELSECAHLSRIDSLKLSQCEANASSLEQLFDASGLDLSQFYLLSSRFDADISRAFANGSGVQNLRSLVIQGLRSVVEIDPLIAKLNQLKFLSFAHDHTDAVLAIADSNLPIETLQFGGGIGLTGCEAIANSTKLPRLKTLDLSRPFIPVGGRRLVEIGMPKLERLSISGHDLNDDSVKELTKNFPALCYLDIRGNPQLTFRSFRHLADSPFLSQLRCLKLNHNSKGRKRDIMAITRSPYFSGEAGMLQFPIQHMYPKVFESLEKQYGKDFFWDVYGHNDKMQIDVLGRCLLLPLPCELP
ncbi:MAG: hypothetical protein ACI9G1_004157 [Pirellulaceae bacterium]|jgi:uncharacterized protein (TIGR02996 family)